MLGPNPQGAQTIQQPLQTRTVEHQRIAAVGNVHFGGGAMVGEQIAALPLRGDVVVRHWFQPGAQDGLMQILGVAELDQAFRRLQPVLRQQADHRLATRTSLIQRPLPPLARPDTSVRVHIQIDLVDQTRLVLDQPLLDRHRLAAVKPRMTQEHPRHASPPTAHESATKSGTPMDCRAHQSRRLPNRRILSTKCDTGAGLQLQPPQRIAPRPVPNRVSTDPLCVSQPRACISNSTFVGPASNPARLFRHVCALGFGLTFPTPLSAIDLSQLNRPVAEAPPTALMAPIHTGSMP
jgi:hypothetical protein